MRPKSDPPLFVNPTTEVLVMNNTLRFTVLGSLLTAQALTAQTASQTAPPSSISSQQTATAQTSSASAPLIGFGLEDGTPVKLRLTRNLSSASDKKGDTVDFEVIEDVNVNGTLVIPRGGVAWATITDAEPKRRMGRGGKLDVNVDSVRLNDGEKVALRAVKDSKGGGHVGAMTGAMVATSIVFFPAAPLFLFMHGKDINIPKGTEITGYIAGNIPMDQAKFQGAESARAASTVAAVQQTAVSILSTPGAADVEVDGKFVGNTPATLTLASGEHTVKVSKNGYKPWERALNVSGGTANVNAELQPDK
jgi:PEGA domain